MPLVLGFNKTMDAVKLEVGGEIISILAYKNKYGGGIKLSFDCNKEKVKITRVMKEKHVPR